MKTPNLDDIDKTIVYERKQLERRREQRDIKKERWDSFVAYTQVVLKNNREDRARNKAGKIRCVIIAIPLIVILLYGMQNSFFITLFSGGALYFLFHYFVGYNGDLADIEVVAQQRQEEESVIQSEYDVANNLLEESEVLVKELEEKRAKDREEIEANIKKYGHEKAIRVSQLFEQLLAYEKAIVNINSLFVRYDQDNEIHTEQNNPITAIRDKAESVNREFYSLMTTTESEYKAFCDFGTHDIAHAKGEIEPDEYFVISKRLEAKMIRAIEVRAENNELSENIKKLDKQSL